MQIYGGSAETLCEIAGGSFVVHRGLFSKGERKIEVLTAPFLLLPTPIQILTDKSEQPAPQVSPSHLDSKKEKQEPLVAIRHNPVLKRYYLRLVEKEGK